MSPRFISMQLRPLLVAAAIGLAGSVAIAQQESSTGWAAPRTADGHPDLSGIWANDSATPLERPEGFEGKPELTPEEFAALKERADELSRTSSDAPFFGEVFRAATSGAEEFESICAGTGNHNAFWLPAREFEARTSLIVDPPDGRIPYTPEARESLAAQSRQLAGSPASWEQLPLITRCITNGVPNLLPGYNANYLIAQTSDHVVILQELLHEARIIPLDGRPHLPSGIRQWVGDSRGSWEGDTLLVTTTNFTGKTRVRGASDALRLVERYTRIGPDRLQYEFTFEDPVTFARPWTARITLRRIEGPIFEYSCHEGNRGLENILRGARVQEAAQTVAGP